MSSDQRQKINESAKLLLNHRTQSGLTQKQLAIRLGYSSPQFVSNIERGEAQLPLKKARLAEKVLSIKGRELGHQLIDEVACRAKQDYDRGEG